MRLRAHLSNAARSDKFHVRSVGKGFGHGKASRRVAAELCSDVWEL